MKIYLLLLLVPSLVFAFGSGTTKQFDQIENNTGTDIVLKPVNDVKIDTFSGAFVLQSGTLKEIEESSVSNTELSYLSGSTSNIQTQIDSKTPLIRLLTTTAPLLIDAGASADLSADRTLSISVATAIADGYLSLTDWNTFNNKTPTARLINTTSPIIGGGDLTADRTISIPVATTGVDGYLSSTDWNTFNNKSDGTGFVDTTTNQSIAGIKTFTGQLVATSTTNGFHPAPTMTEAQRDLITGEVSGDLIFNSDTGVLNIFDGADWIELAGGGGAGGSRLNLVEFPSFEDDITEGTCTNCSRAAETTEVLTTTNNITSLKITATAASADYTVDKNTSAQWNTGMGILKSAWIKTSADDVKIISRVDGADETVELDIVGDGNWHQYKIPTKSGTTSNGYKISIPTDTSIVYVDETEIKPNDELLQVGQAHFVGSVDLSNNCYYRRANTTYGIMLDIDGCSATSTIGDVSLPTNTLQSGIKINNFRTDGYYRVELQGLIYGNSTNVCSYTISKSILYEGNGTVYLNANAPTLSESQIDANIRFNTGDTGEVFILNRGTAAVVNCLVFGQVGNPSAWSVHFYPDAQNTIVTQTTELDASISNHLSGRVSSAGSLQSTDYDWISSTTNPSTGNYTVNFKAGIFTVNPSCNIKGLSGTRDCTGQGGTGPASWSVKCFNSGTSTLINTDFFIQCDKQGIDVNKSATIVGKFESINSSNLINIQMGTVTNTLVNNVNSVIKFEVERNSSNTEGHYNTSTGIFTAPKTSKYLLSTVFLLNAFTWGVGERVETVIGTTTQGYIYGRSQSGVTATGGANVMSQGSIIVHLNEGDTLDIKGYQNSGGNLTLFANSNYNYMSIQELPDTESIIKNLNDNKKIECQTKVLNGDVTANGVLPALEFAGLTIGKRYEINMSPFYNFANAGNDNISLTATNNAAAVCFSMAGNHDALVSKGSTICGFAATGTTLTFTSGSITAGNDIRGNSTISETFVRLCELNDNYVETTKF